MDFGFKQAPANSASAQERIVLGRFVFNDFLDSGLASAAAIYMDIEIALGTDKCSAVTFSLIHELCAFREPGRKSGYPVTDIAPVQVNFRPGPVVIVIQTPPRGQG